MCGKTEKQREVLMVIGVNVTCYTDQWEKTHYAYVLFLLLNFYQ